MIGAVGSLPYHITDSTGRALGVDSSLAAGSRVDHGVAAGLRLLIWSHLLNDCAVGQTECGDSEECLQHLFFLIYCL